MRFLIIDGQTKLLLRKNFLIVERRVECPMFATGAREPSPTRTERVMPLLKTDESVPLSAVM